MSLRATKQRTEALTKSNGRIRVSRHLIAVLSNGQGPVRVGCQRVEVLTQVPTDDNKVRATRQHVSVLTGGNGRCRATKQAVEALVLPGGGNLAISRQLIEVLGYPYSGGEDGGEDEMGVALQQTIELAGFSNNTQGEAAFVHALLQCADSSGQDLLANPVAEAIRRLEAAGINPHALLRIKQMLFAQQDKYDRGIR